MAWQSRKSPSVTINVYVIISKAALMAKKRSWWTLVCPKASISNAMPT